MTYKATLRRSELRKLPSRILKAMQEIRLNRLHEARLRAGRSWGAYLMDSYAIEVGTLEADIDLIDDVLAERNEL